MHTFSFNSPIKISDEGKWLLAVTSFEATITVFKRADENNSFEIIKPGSWKIPSCLEDNVVDKLKNLRKPKHENNIELQVLEVRKRNIKIKINSKESSLSDFDTSKTGIVEKLKNAENNDVEDMVYRFQLTDDEIIDILDLKYIPTKRTGFSLNPGIYDVVDLSNTLKIILPDNLRVSVTIGDVRLKSNLKINQTLIFTKKSFFIQF